MFEANVAVYDSLDALDLLYSLVRMNVRWMQQHGPVDLLDGSWKYRTEKKNCNGSENWDSLRRIFERQEKRAEQGKPYLLECEETGPIECAKKWYEGKLSATLSVCLLPDGLLHVQTLYKGKIIDPCPALGMPVPRSLAQKIFDVNWKRRIRA